MALTKVTNYMITGAVVNVFDYMTAAQIADVQSGAFTLDVTAAINDAIAALPATYDITYNFSGNEYSGHPSTTLYFPAGTYKVTSSIVIQKNNVTIRGDGWNNSIIKFSGAGTIQGVVRFLNALGCEMSDMGIDGGLPYDPTMLEVYGADAGLICDLTPFFTSRNLWIANTRKSGLVAIHLWESFFENLQVRNTGYFTNETTPVKGAAIYFCADATIKQSSNALGAGYESDNTVFVKAKLVPVGAVVLCEAPTQNITLISPITENRDFAAYFAALSYTKYYIASANNFVVQGGYFYGHSHTYACDATLFAVGGGTTIGTAIKNFYVYTSAPTGFPEVTKIFSVANQHPVCFDGLVIDDNDAKITAPFTILSTAGYPGIVWGDISYSSASTVNVATLLGSNTLGYKGTLSSTNTTLQEVNRNTYFANARQYNTLNGNTNQETFSCRAWCCFNGVTGAILASGNISGLVKNSTGNYTLTFTTPLSDSNYATTVTANKVNSALETTEVGTQLQGSVNVANRAGATYYDPTIFNVTVFR